MSEILRKWIITRLGIIIDYDLKSFEDIAQDGTLIAQILYNYGIISNDNLKQIITTYDIKNIESNWALLRKWLKSLGIEVFDKEIHGILFREKLIATRLFYQLYVTLNSKSKVQYIKNDRVIPTQSTSRSMDRVYNACEINELTISPCVDEIKGVLKWHKQKYKKLTEHCSTIRDEYTQKLRNKIKMIEDKKLKEQRENTKKTFYNTLGTTSKCKRRKIIDVLQKPDISIKFDKDGHCITDFNKATKYINYLKHRNDKCSTLNNFHKQLNQMILLDLINKIVDKEDTEFKKMLTEKLLNQSYYEKKMTLKLNNIRDHKKIMLENLQYENKKVIAQKEEDFVNKLFQKNENATREEKQFIENKLRQYELHKRLWSEKLKKENKIKYQLCKDIVNSFVDLAIKYSEYHQQYGIRPNASVWDEWCVLFRSEQPIFDIVQDMSLIIVKKDCMDEELTLELYRQNGLDDCDFNDYLNQYGIWNIPSTFELLESNQYKIDCAANILGYTVHKLLLIKYPKPEQIQTPVFPPTNIRASVGVLNQELVSLLQKALTSKEVLVVDLPTVINNFICTYLEESKVDVDESIDIKSKKIKEKAKSKEKVTDKKIDIGKGQKESIPKEEFTQTPRIFPCCEPTLSPIGKLGKYAYETLNLGLQMNENLTTLMIMEYIKKYTFIKGWVLINYPETLNEAYYLEELYNGKKIPEVYKSKSQNIFDDIESFEDREDIFKLPVDEFETIRLSKLLPNPKQPEPETYKSILTSFIFMSAKIKKEDIQFESENIINSLNPLFEFYEKLSVAHKLEYEVVTYELIRELVYLISKDNTFANEIYEDLVERAIKEVTTKKNKKDIPSKSKEKKIEIISKSSKNSKLKKKPSEENIPEEINDLASEILESSKPGELLWDYVDIPISKQLSKLLAAMWENIELIYINDFKELFFLKRVTQSYIMPYIREVQTNMQKFVDRPDIKQEHLHKFQTAFNEIQCDLRGDDEFKAELHFRVREFRNSIWDLCDKRMQECEIERRRIIDDNWFVDHSVGLVNIYVKATQLELDRCVQTLQLLQDYYSAIALQDPMAINYHKSNLNTLDITKSEEKIKYTNSLLNNFCDNKSSLTNKFTNFLEQMLQNATGIVESWKNASNNSVKILDQKFGEKNGPINQTKKKKSIQLTEMDILISQNIDKLIAEWHSAIEGEILRTLFRLNLIFTQGTNTLQTNITNAEYLFQELYVNIQERYIEEIESTDLICWYFSRAIEAGEPIQVRLVIDGVKVFIDDKCLFYPDNAFDYGEVHEWDADYDFTINQLDLLVKIFIDLAPNGIMSQKTFAFLLEDMIVANVKEGCFSPLPHHWRYLEPEILKKFMKVLYRNDDYINWKDFIIWNLSISYPNEKEILDVRQQFVQIDPDKLQYVNKQQYSTVRFWFEDNYKDEENTHRMTLFKELLYKMFQTGDDKVNYSALLLYFCKDEEPLQGVIKAIELAIGQLVCWDLLVGEKFINALQKQRAIENAQKKKALSAANSVVEEIFDRTCQECISTFSFLDQTEEFEFSVCSEEYILQEEVIEEEIFYDDNLPSLCYFLKWSVLLKVMTTALPKESTVMCVDGKSICERLHEIYCSLQNGEFDNRVLMHEFLHNEDFVDIIDKTRKFFAIYPPGIVRDLIEVCTCKDGRFEEKEKQLL